MRAAAIFFILASIGACAPVEQTAQLPVTDDALAKLIGSRVAGPPAHCVNLYQLRGNFLLPEQSAVLFEGPGQTLYLNRFADRCDSVRNGLALRIISSGGRLCAGEIVELIDPVAGISHGACPLGEFIPYRTAD